MDKNLVSIDLAALERSFGTVDAITGEPTDVYRAEAAKIFGVPEDQVTTEQRLYAKQQAYINMYRSGGYL